MAKCPTPPNRGTLSLLRKQTKQTHITETRGELEMELAFTFQIWTPDTLFSLEDDSHIVHSPACSPKLITVLSLFTECCYIILLVH